MLAFAIVALAAVSTPAQEVSEELKSPKTVVVDESVKSDGIVFDSESLDVLEEVALDDSQKSDVLEEIALNDTALESEDSSLEESVIFNENEE